MKLLLDTGELYRIAVAPDALSQPVQELLQHESHEVFVSLVSAVGARDQVVAGQAGTALPCGGILYAGHSRPAGAGSRNRLKAITRVTKLPAHHKDPFDRLIIAQAIVEQCTIVASDVHFSAYRVQVIW